MDLGAYALTGVIVSGFIQWTKGWIQNRGGNIIYAIFICIVLGTGVYFANLIPGEYLKVIVGIYAAANSVYLLFFKGHDQ